LQLENLDDIFESGDSGDLDGAYGLLIDGKTRWGVLRSRASAFTSDGTTDQLAQNSAELFNDCQIAYWDAQSGIGDNHLSSTNPGDPSAAWRLPRSLLERCQERLTRLYDNTSEAPRNSRDKLDCDDFNSRDEAHSATTPSPETDRERTGPRCRVSCRSSMMPSHYIWEIWSQSVLDERRIKE
jgi:hypothetical protein